MEQDLFKDLPSEIINDILLRLPLRDIATSKCVCKSWLDLLKKDEFVKSHLSRSPAALSIFLPGMYSSRCTLYELKDDEIDVESSHDHRYNSLTKFDFPRKVKVLGSANGLLFLVNNGHKSINNDVVYVWNPITSEYIELNFNQEKEVSCAIIYGFGVTKISGRHKVVQIVHNSSDCYVYTLGTGSWRSVRATLGRKYFHYGYYNPCVFLNGNLHWLVWDSDDNSWISCFDLETECFSRFSTSPLPEEIENVSVLRDCLCLCDCTFLRDGIVDIWLMKEYGVEKSWRKEYVIKFNPDFDTIALETVTPIKVFKDGDILMDWGDKLLFYYSNKAKTTSEEFGGVFNEFQWCYSYPVLLTPSFLSLKSFGMENVISGKGGTSSKTFG